MWTILEKSYGVAIVRCIQGTGRPCVTYDICVSNACRRKNIAAQPEDKLFGFLVAAPVLAIAFWVSSITIPPLVTNLTPRIPIASLVMVGFSVVEFDTVLAGYLTDTYTSHAASANASLSFLRTSHVRGSGAESCDVRAGGAGDGALWGCGVVCEAWEADSAEE